jgi:hypothetical protein
MIESAGLGLAAMIGITVAMMFMAGVAEPPDRTILRVSIDTAGALVSRLGSLVILYCPR